MSVETGADYSTFVQPVITLAQAQAWASAGMERFCLAMDTAPETAASARNLHGAGISLDAYRELSDPAGYVAQVQDAITGFAPLAQEGISFRRLWLTAEDLSFAITADRLPSRRARQTFAGTRYARGLAQPDAVVSAFHQAVDACAGFDIGIYTGAWYWPVYMADTHDFANLPLWHAGYDGVAALELVDYGGFGRMSAHQYASPVSVAGSVGLDLDVWGT